MLWPWKLTGAVLAIVVAWTLHVLYRSKYAVLLGSSWFPIIVGLTCVVCTGGLVMIVYRLYSLYLRGRYGVVQEHRSFMMLDSPCANFASTSEDVLEQDGANSSFSRILRVTLLADEWRSSKGGLSTINRELAKQLANSPNVEVTIFVPKCRDEDRKASQNLRITIVEAKERPGFDPIDWLLLPPSDLSIDVVVGHGVELGRYAQFIRESHCCKWVQVVHVAHEELAMYRSYPGAASKGYDKHQAEIDLCKIADFVVAVGPKLADNFSAYLRSCKKEVFNLTPSIFDEFTHLEQASCDGKKFRLLVFGSGDPEDFELKGYDIAAQAVAQLNDPNYHLIFVGAPSGKEDEVKDNLLKHGISQSRLTVRSFCESREKLANLFCEADLAIMPSRTEGFGLTGLEALSAGLPVLVCHNSGFAEALNEVLFGSSCVVGSEDAKVWAEEIKRVQQKDRERRLRECQVLRTSYAEQFNWQKQCEALVEKLLSMVYEVVSKEMSFSTGIQASDSLKVGTGTHEAQVKVRIGCETITTARPSPLQEAGTGRFQREIVSNQTYPTTQQIFNLIVERWLKEKQPLSEFEAYMEQVKKLIVLNKDKGSLLITVECSSLDILEGLWEDYTSGHLNQVAQELLVTPEILKEHCLTSVKLEVAILKDEYDVCKEYFLQSAVMKSTKDISTAFHVLLVGNFLVNTGRYRKAIELLKECLVLLDTKVVVMEEMFYRAMYMSLSHACHKIGDSRQAIEYAEKALVICKSKGEQEEEVGLCSILASEYWSLGNYVKAKEFLEKALAISIVNGDRHGERANYSSLGTVYQSLGDYAKAKECLEKALAISIEMCDTKGEGAHYGNLGTVYQSLGDYMKARYFHKKALAISIEIGDRKGEGAHYGNLGTVYHSLGDYMEAKEFLEKALAISKEVGDRQGEGARYGNLGTVYQSLCDYVKAKGYYKEALAISIEIGNRNEEGSHYGNLGTVYQSLGDYMKAKEFIEKAVVISKEIGDRQGEVATYGNLGTVYQYLGEYVMARECLEKALAISIEIGDRQGEGATYGNLGTVYRSVGDFVKATEFLKKALDISIEIGDRQGEEAHYGNLGSILRSCGDYVKAKIFIGKALTISKEIGDRQGEGAQYGNLGTLYELLGDYMRAKEFLEKALAINIEIGNRQAEGVNYGNLGTIFQSLGDYVKAKECLAKALAISIEIGDSKQEGAHYGNLGALYQSLGDYLKAKELLEKALAISIEIGDRKGEGVHYGKLGTVYQSLDNHMKAQEFLEKALAVSIEIGDRKGEGTYYGNLGKVFSFLGFNELAEEYYKKGLAIAIELKTVDIECEFQVNLAFLYVSMKRMKDAFSCLSAAIYKFEDLRGFLGCHDQYKINFADENSSTYKLFASMLCNKQEITKALLVSELGRARALADLMSAQYSLKGLQASQRLVLADIEETLYSESYISICLYISFSSERLTLWIIKANKIEYFQVIDKDALVAIPNRHESSLLDCVESLANQSYRDFTVLLKEECEDRSLFTFYEGEAECQAQTEEKCAGRRLLEESVEEKEEEPALQSLYKMIISPVADLLEGSEIIICPPPTLYQVPFAALMDDEEMYLSEKLRIRLIPSLFTLKLIRDSPADYHSQTGVLIVGDPDIGRTDIPPLPCAREEAEMIGRLLHVQPLIGHEATKQAVLQGMRSVSLIHIASHGDAKRGEIALAPLRPMNRIPQKEDFVLTMSDVSEVQLRAKLVVLSCCHSGRGEIRAEGVIGIARAFLGSGARSVLVSLWAVGDMATKEFMCQFYKHLSLGESASECLHETMKWMRGRPEYCAVREWAPFMLVGDDVAFNFEELTRDQRNNSTRVSLQVPYVSS